MPFMGGRGLLVGQSLYKLFIIRHPAVCTFQFAAMQRKQNSVMMRQSPT
jgi:hypothetical protein